MFSQASVILSTGGCTPPRQTHLWQTPPWADTPCRADTPWADTPPPTGDGYCSGRYASYWNAFLLNFAVTNPRGRGSLVPPLRLISLILAKFLAKKLPNNRLAHPPVVGTPLGNPDPPLIWITLHKINIKVKIFIVKSVRYSYVPTSNLMRK